MTANRLFYGDNLEVLREKIVEGSVDLCYIDPPFNSQRNYNQIYHDKGEIAQVRAFTDTWRWDDRAARGYAEIVRDRGRRFTTQTKELLGGLVNVLGKGNTLAYIVSLTLRLQEIHRVLKATGSLYVHCDPTMSHYLKVVLDGIFCPRGGEFRNEIVWCYSNSGRSKDRFAKKHDTILLYAKQRKPHFFPAQVAIPYSREYLDSHFRDKDSAGRQCRKRYDAGKWRTYYPNAGMVPNDWWSDIPPVNSQAKERLGFDTQKPEELLERIILASSDRGGVVLDAYCGCGTTVAVAERLGRKWIGIDITYQSISTILARLEKAHGKKFIDKIALSGIPRDMESAVALAHKKDDRLRKEFEKWAVLTYSNGCGCINEAKGIDGFALLHNGKKPAKVIFSVKSGKVGVAQIRDLRGALEREGAIAGCLITLEEPTAPMLAYARLAGSAHLDTIAGEFPRLRIVTIAEILAGARIRPTLVLDRL